MLLRIIYLLMLIALSYQGYANNEEKLKNMYYQLKAKDMRMKQKTDSVFLVLYSLSYLNPVSSEELSIDFINYSKKQNQIYGKSYMALAYSYFDKGDIKRSIKYIEISMSYLHNEKDSISMCFALQVLAENYKRSGNYDLAIETSEKALVIAKQIKNEMLISNTYNDFGFIMTRKKNYVLAKEYYYKALSYRKRKNDIQTSYTNLGIAYKNLNQYDSAFYFQRKSLVIANELQSKYAIAFVYNDLGALFLKVNNLDSAFYYLQNSIKLRKQIDEQWELGFTYNYLGELYRMRKLERESINTLRLAISLAKKTGNINQLYESYEQLSLTFSQFNRYDSAFYYNQKFEKLKDSISTAQNNLAAEIVVSNHKTEIKQQEINKLKSQTELQKMSIQRQKNWLWITGIGVFALICFVFLFARNRQLRLAKIQLENQKKEDQLQTEIKQKIEEDRKRISRELHDNIGANLTVFKEMVSEAGTSNNNSELQQLAEETIQELRKSVWLLNHNEITFDEWIIRLREYFRYIKKVHIQATAPDDYSLIIKARIVTELFRVIQEAVTNALKHASCSSIIITIKHNKQHIYINIEDNGVGLDDSKNQGFGLSNMKERVASIHGEITFNNIEEKGASVSITVPIK